jgi:nitrogen fixation protein FixH
MTDQNTGTEEARNSDAVDERGTNQTEGRAILKRLRDNGFDSSDEKLAVALGRPVEEVEAWTAGMEPVDDDVIMKARGIALQRGIEVE